MEIETYELQKTEAPVEEKERKKYDKLVNELGLDGMSQLLKDEGVIPFQRLDDTQARIWKAYCPGKYKIEEYKESIIPLRVLGLIKVCQDKIKKTGNRMG